MTDITDPQAKFLTAFARGVAAHPGSYSDDLVESAKAVLATVDDPASTLSEELRGWERIFRDEGRHVDATSMRDLATRAEKIEQDLDEARAAAKTWQEQDENDCEMYAEDVAGLLATLAETREALAVEGRRVEKRTAERDEARAEVERLTKSVIDSIPLPMPPGDIPGTALPIHRTRRSKSKETLADSLPAPADVKPGEAWIVEFDGRQWSGVKDGDRTAPWELARSDGSSATVGDDFVTLVSRLVLAPRVITDPEELDRLSRRAVIRDADGVVCERAPLGDGWFSPGNRTDQETYIALPVTVLLEPRA